MDSVKERPTHIEIADHFFNDATDLLIRFRYCFKSDGPRFDIPHSRRVKCFIDLRMAMESILKGYAAYYVHSEISGKKLIRRVEKYSHHVEKLSSSCKAHLPLPYSSKTNVMCEQLSNLPVGLRYRLDATDFKENRTNKYYDTIGSDSWLDELATVVEGITKHFGKELNKESRIVSLSEAWEEYSAPRHVKYPSKS